MFRFRQKKKDEESFGSTISRVLFPSSSSLFPIVVVTNSVAREQNRTEQVLFIEERNNICSLLTIQFVLFCHCSPMKYNTERELIKIQSNDASQCIEKVRSEADFSLRVCAERNEKECQQKRERDFFSFSLFFNRMRGELHDNQTKKKTPRSKSA